jgi:hypothetical protein
MFVNRFLAFAKERFSPQLENRGRALYDAFERRTLDPDQPFFSDRFLR